MSPGFSSALVAAATADRAASRFFSTGDFCAVPAWDSSNSAFAKSSSALIKAICFSALAAALASAAASVAFAYFARSAANADGQFDRVADLERPALHGQSRVDVVAALLVSDLKLRPPLVGAGIDEDLVVRGHVEAQADRPPRLPAGERELEPGREVVR